MLKPAIENEIMKLEAQAKQMIANANANAGALQAFRHVLELLKQPQEPEVKDGSNTPDPAV
ncbi:hypothetical protein KAR91_18200 [Candidatus Pacearchaeota archaeon]|nr:hypothetical protein [Candidatus Pacearchaeota archaeon]